MKDRFEIVEIDTQGEERILSSDFTSYVDAIKAAAFSGLRQQVSKVQVRDAKSKEWIWEMFIK